MGMKILKRISSIRSPKKGSLKKTKNSFEDGETASEYSNRSSLLSSTTGVLVESLSKEGKFEEVLKVVAKSQVDDWQPAEMPEGNDLDSWPAGVPTPLHLVLAYSPPVAVVQTLIQLLNKKFHIDSPEEYADDLGRTPLHIAVASGCTVEIAQLLLSGACLLMPAVYRDSLQRTPLHWSCRAQCRKKKREEATARWHQKQVILYLLQEYPEAACLSDADGQTPLDYARGAKLLPSIIDSLKEEFDYFGVSSNSKSSSDGDESDGVPPNVPAEERLPQKDDLSTIGLSEAEFYNILNDL